MPEGETIHRAATALRTALVGKPMLRFTARRLLGPEPVVGRTIESVTSHGRHLEIEWDDGLVLHTNMRFKGAWHLYRVDERWRKGTDQMRIVVEVEEWVAVCFSAPVVDSYRQFDRHRHPGFGRLGPDLCQGNADLDECVERILNYLDREAPISEVILDQHVACGVGNVDRSEALWAIGLSPFATVGSLTADDARQIVESSTRLSRANLSDRRRVKVQGVDAGLAVYGRNGQPCQRCGDTVQVKRVGEMHRLVYWCPSCQARGDRRVAPTPPSGVERPMDPHPAATLYLSDLPWNRHDDTLRPGSDRRHDPSAETG